MVTKIHIAAIRGGDSGVVLNAQTQVRLRQGMDFALVCVEVDAVPN